jgi:hypothetical protein
LWNDVSFRFAIGTSYGYSYSTFPRLMSTF